MAPPGNQPVWLFDEARRLHYYNDPRDGARVYEDGTRIYEWTPRVIAHATPDQLPPPQPRSGTSPPDNNSQFLFSGPNLRNGPQNATSGHEAPAPGNQPVWLLDEARRRRYYNDPRDGARVYEDGTRIPREIPRAIPRATPDRLPQTQPRLGTSPPGNNSQLPSGPNLRNGRQNATPGHEAPAPGNQPVWLLDEARRRRYHNDPRDGARVYEDGTRIPREIPRAIPRATPDRLPQTQPRGGTSPPGNNSQLKSGPNLRNGPQNATPGHEALAEGISGLQIGGPTTTPFHPNPAALALAGPSAPLVTQSDGIRVVTTQNPRSRVTTNIGTGPPERITDPVLYGQGVRAWRALYGTNGEQEELFSNFTRRRHDFFFVGRVFMILWSEPAGETATDIGSVVQNDRSRPGLFVGRHGELVYSKVRKFVVIRTAEKYCTALPIVSYGAQGVSKIGVNKDEHGIIYTGPTAPEPLPAERPNRGERGMSPTALRVTPDEPDLKLDNTSRIDYAKVHTIEHNLKVAPFGVVHPASLEPLDTQWRMVLLEPAPSRPGPNAAMRGAAGGPRRSSVQRSGSSGSGNLLSPRGAFVDAVREEDESEGATTVAGSSALPRRGTANTTAGPSALPPRGITSTAPGAAQAGVRGVPATINNAEIEMVRLSIRRGMQGGQAQAAVVEAIRQRYIAAGHSPERAMAVIRAALAQARPAAS